MVMASSRNVIFVCLCPSSFQRRGWGLRRPLTSQVSHFTLIAIKLLICIDLVVHIAILPKWFNGGQLGNVNTGRFIC